MAKLRPGRCYKKLHRPYTRQSIHKPRKSYIKGAPKPRIAQYEMGTKKNYSKKLFLVSEEACQIRHNALESARISIVKHLEKQIKEFFVKLRIYPHHVFRENPLATGAGADRFQQGMRMSFGRPIGTAARIRIGQRIFEVQVDDENINVAKVALKRASHKLPAKCKILVE